MNFHLTDFRYTWKLMLRSPGITLIIIVLLGLGTGGVAAVFNPIYSLVFAIPPFPQPDRLVLVGGDIPLFNMNFNEAVKNETIDRIFSNMAGYAPRPLNVYITDIGKEITAVDVSIDFFETLGIKPLYGYDFRYNENIPTIVISNRFWRNEMMSADDVIGKIIRTQIGSYTIVGIMPDNFDFPAGADAWFHNGKNGRMLIDFTRRLLGRLQPGISIRNAASQLKVMNFEETYGVIGFEGPVLQSIKTFLYGDRQYLFWMLGTMSILFLVLVCSSVMNILVTLGIRRKQEMALRMSLGATRWNLVFQLLREILPLVVVGTLAGLLLSETIGKWLTVQFPMLMKGNETVVPVKMAFSGALVFVVTIISGLVPSLHVSRVDLNTQLKSGAEAKRRFFSLQELLAGVQLGLALALLISAGLLLRTIIDNVNYPVGWTSRSITVVRVTPPVIKPPRNYGNITQQTKFLQEFQDYVETIPEVATVGVLSPIPFSEQALYEIQQPRSIAKTLEVIKKRPENSTESTIYSIQGFASPNAFEMLGIPLFTGRFFTQADVLDEFIIRREIEARERPFNKDVGGVVIINQSLAKQFWPAENAVGKTIYYDGSNAHEIVGVVYDFYMDPNNKKIVPAVYSPMHNPVSYPASFLVKLHSDKLVKDFRQRLSARYAGSADIDVQSLSNIVSNATINIRIATHLLVSFALLGIVVAGLGVYATTSLMAASRTRETGIMMAMGATFWNILFLALWRGMRTILVGLPFGLFVAWILSRMLSSFIFQLNATDYLAWITSCVLLVSIVTVAALIPALRATRVNPVDSLRNE